MKNKYRSGRIQETKVARHLQDDLGWTNVRKSAGSRGPYDIYARTPSGVKAYVQVKSGSAQISRGELRALRSMARNRGGVAVTAQRQEGKLKLRFRGRWK